MVAAAGKTIVLGRGKTVRFTKTDACGMPLAGSANSFVTKSFVTIKATPQWDNGQEIKVTIADGSVNVYDPGDPTLLGYNIDVEFAKMDTGVIPMLSADPIVVDYNGTPVGWEDRTKVGLNDAHFAMEIWTASPGTVCSGPNPPTGYLVIPHVSKAYFQLDDIANKEINGHIMGFTLDNAWGKGPYMPVAADSANTPGRLIAPMSPTSHRHFEVTTVSPPAIPTTLGPVALVLPTPY